MAVNLAAKSPNPNRVPEKFVHARCKCGKAGGGRNYCPAPKRGNPVHRGFISSLNPAAREKLKKLIADDRPGELSGDDDASSNDSSRAPLPNQVVVPRRLSGKALADNAKKQAAAEVQELDSIRTLLRGTSLTAATRAALQATLDAKSTKPDNRKDIDAMRELLRGPTLTGAARTALKETVDAYDAAQAAAKGGAAAAGTRTPSRPVTQEDLNTFMSAVLDTVQTAMRHSPRDRAPSRPRDAASPERRLSFGGVSTAAPRRQPSKRTRTPSVSDGEGGDDVRTISDSSVASGEERERERAAKRARLQDPRLRAPDRKALLRAGPADLLSANLEHVLFTPETWCDWVAAPGEAEEQRARGRHLVSAICDRLLPEQSAAAKPKEMGSFYYEREFLRQLAAAMIDGGSSPADRLERVSAIVAARIVAAYIAMRKGSNKGAKYFRQKTTYLTADPAVIKYLGGSDSEDDKKGHPGSRGGGQPRSRSRSRGRSRGGGGRGGGAGGGASASTSAKADKK